MTPAVTFLFTDIEGSTERWERQHDAMAAALVRHDELLRTAIEGRGGHVFKTVGDAFYAAFADAAAGLAAALDAWRAVVAEDWQAFGPDFADVRVRMGLHAGRAEARGGDYFSPALNRTARLTSAGHGGQVLLSHRVRQDLGDALPAGLALRDLGEHRLKDLRHAERIWQVMADGLPDVTLPLTTAGELGARDRIVVVDPTAADREGDDEPTVVTRTVGETLAALRQVILRDAPTVTLTTDQVREAAAHRPADLSEYRLGRVAEWSQPRYRLDGRFVAMTLLVDQGEEAVSGRWAAKEERYNDLERLLAAVAEPAVVVLGPPGSGKSTLLRHLELDAAPWRSAEIRPTVAEILPTLPLAETLPPLPQTGWEETTLLAAAMAPDAEAFVRGVMAANLALAGRCAAQTRVSERLSAAVLDGFRWALVHRSRDPEANLRDRIACGLAVGDPDFGIGFRCCLASPISVRLGH